MPEVKITSSLSACGDRNLWRQVDNYGRFSFVNFLGAAWIKITVTGCPEVTIRFEVASPKLDYEQEYRSMLESIGRECQQLLLDWGTPTTLNLISDPAKRAQTLLEQFSYLSYVLGPDRLDLYLEIIQRQPHSRLESERDWKPAGAANPSLFLRNPLRHGRGWHRQDGAIVAEELREERRYDSLDTPPNRFLKFALKDFRNLCDDVLQAKRWPAESPVVREAEALQQSLDSFLALPLFDDVGELQRIPFESTTLQRREGYREILQAWLVLDVAAKIDWPGRGEAYKGTSRRVDKLYEYWLYFVLVRAFKEVLKMEPEHDPRAIVDGALPFCCRADDGRLVVNLSEDHASFCRFRWSLGERKLAVHFFYNREFKNSAVGERGSYSSTFYPDYTLVIIPEELADLEWQEAEKKAEEQGRIAYLHFDAKYRGENLAGIIGSDEKDHPEPKATAKAKTDDLYKMHTYNEAIRRTVGSYVLYPGIASELDKGKKTFERYHEIIPGIGAFALRPPSNEQPPVGLSSVCDFIRNILTHHLTQFSQSYRIDYWTESTVREDSVEYSTGPASLRLGNRPPKDTQLLLCYVRGEDAALDCRNTHTFFCHAVEWKTDASGEPGEATDLQFDPFRSDFFVAYYRRQTAGWVAKVKEVKLVTAQERATEVGRPLTDMHAAYYYRFQLEDIQEIAPRDVTDLVAHRPGKPAARRVSEFALCPVAKR